MRTLARIAALAATVVSMASGARALPSAQEAKKEPTGVITGRVTLGGKPIQGVTVVLSKTQSTPQPEPGPKAKTDEDGRYRLAGVAAGSYTVASFAPAFVGPMESGFGEPGKKVTLDDGEEVEGVDFALTRGGVITGRVTDAEGRPVIAQFVHLTQVDERGQRRPSFRLNPFRFETDDRGAYRMYGLPAGRYLVSVGDDRDRGIVRVGFGGGFYAHTFHPGVTDESKATIIEVTAGGEATGVDITVSRASKTFTASGRIVDADTGKPVAGVQYGHGSLRNDAKSIGALGWSGNRTNARGEFLIEGLTPGRYATFALSETESDFYSEPATFEVSDGNVAGLEIKIRRGATVSGVAVIEGTNDPDALARLAELQLRVFVSSQELSAPRMAPVRVAPDGGFRITGLQPGRARILLGGPPPKGVSLVRVERDGTAQRDGIEVNAGENVTGVRVVFAYGTGVVRGQVRIQGGELPDGVRLFVSARRMGEEAQIGLGAEVDARRRFVIEGLSEGDYEITLRALPAGFGGPPPRLPVVKQPVKVAQGGEAEVTLVLDLGAKPEKDH